MKWSLSHLDDVRAEARSWYAGMMMDFFGTDPKDCHTPSWYDGSQKRNALEKHLEAFAEAHPDLNAWQMKAAQYRILAETLTPVVLDHSPFYFITNLSPGPNDGHCTRGNAGGWMFNRNKHLFRDADPEGYDRFHAQISAKVHLACGPYVDTQHYCFPVNHVIKYGLKHYCDRIAETLKTDVTEEERAFLETARAGLLAAKRISERFAEAAEERLKTETDPDIRLNLERLAQAARISPWEKPRHFLEGLNAMWFCRDILGCLDGLGNSHLGHPDYELIDLYRQDLADGWMTESEAFDLIKHFIILGDSHYDKNSIVSGYSDHELEMGYVLGGCDCEGREIFNDITRMFIRAHRETDSVFPKVHYRFSAASSKEYLDAISEDYLLGRSTGGLSNDDSIIPALIAYGRSPEDAREYINHGCWGVRIPGRENHTGGNYYHLLTFLNLCTHGNEEKYEAIGVHVQTFDGCKTFEELYERFMQSLMEPLRFRCNQIARYAKLGTKVNPIPLFSVLIEGCLENKKDFYAGSSKYRNDELDPSEFANTVDGLLAIKTLCFDQQKVTLADFLQAVRDGWEGHEDIREMIQDCPYYGDESDAALEMAGRLYDDLYFRTRDLTNGQGGQYELSYYVYREYLLDAEKFASSADGRKRGDLLAMGFAPTRYHKKGVSMAALLNTIAALDETKAVNHSITLQLPLGSMNSEKMEALLRAIAACKLKHIQLNCIDPATLRDAKEHPEMHQDIVVRVCGFSAKFTSLAEKWQDEVIHRSEMNMG